MNPLQAKTGLAAFVLMAGVAAFEPAATANARDDNPRNRQYDGLIIEYISIEPRVEVRAIGDKPGRPMGPGVVITAHLRNVSSAEVYAAVTWGENLGMEEIGYVAAGATFDAKRSVAADQIPYDQAIEARVYNIDIHKLEMTDSVFVHGERAMRVALLVERKTMEAGDKQFGSFVRRMRGSLEDFHGLLIGPADANAGADAASGLSRRMVTDRFRIDSVEVYDRGSGAADSNAKPQVPAMFWDHPQFDVVIACDEGGPVAGFHLPAYSVGHNYRVEHETGVNGIWSRDGEQALWHELLHFRGVPDYYIHEIRAGAIARWTAEAIQPPEMYRHDLQFSPYQEAYICPLTSAVLNAKAGVARVGACEDPANEFGHMWRWVPAKLRVRVTDDEGEAMAGAKVRLWRSLPGVPGVDDARYNGIAADRAAADIEAELNREGEAVLASDWFGVSAAPDGKRSLWMLIEVEHPTTGEKRFGIVWGLWLNSVYAAGAHDEATWSAAWGEMRPVGSSP